MRLIITVFLCLPALLFGQLQLVDDFTDGDFTTNPPWSGDQSVFQINNGELQLNNTSPSSPDTSYLSTASTILNNGQWSFYFRFEENLTSSNYARVYLASDQANLKGNLNGYYLDFGRSSDKLRLMRQSGSTHTIVLESSSGYLGQAETEVRATVTRDANGNWTLQADTGAVVDPLALIATGTDLTHTSSSFMGVFCRYTSTRADLFYFDDFNCSGQPNVDLAPPVLDSIVVLNANQLLLEFNESLDPASAQTVSNFTVNGGIGNPQTITLGGTNNQELTLSFSNSFTNQSSYQITLNNIGDTAGNTLNITVSFSINDAPATISAIQLISNTQLLVNFSETVTANFATLPGNYSVNNGIGVPSQATQTAASEVQLSFTNPFQTGINYMLTAQNIEDAFGNISTDSVPFRIGSINIFDDFSDGDFSTNPTWKGNTNHFEIDANNQLHLNAPAQTASSYLSTASEIMDEAQWEFYLKMDFATSGSNNTQVFIASLDSILGDTANGYYINIGGSDDEIALYVQNGTNATALIQSPAKFIDTDPVELRVKLNRSASGTFRLYADTNLSGNYINLGSATDSSFLSSQYFGIKCNYTSTRSDLFWFDDFNLSGDPYLDTIPPQVTQIQTLSNNLIEVHFSENLDIATAENPGNYSIDNGIGNPSAAQLFNGNTVQLLLANNLQNRNNYQLTVNGVQDAQGNASNTSAVFSFFTASAGDVVINEIMPDPSPVVGVPPNTLPPAEYIELYNTTPLIVELENWTLTIGNTEEVLSSFSLQPDSFVVITKDESAILFEADLPVLGIDMSSTALTNSGNTITLQSPLGEVISTISYTDDWYNDANKDKGGWSIEQIDPTNRCGGINNWTASLNPIGGTPGRTNSVFGLNPDTIPPAFERLALTGDSSLIIYFTENLGYEIADASLYAIAPNIPITNLRINEPSLDAVELFFSEAIQPNTLYSITLSNYPSDCSGNLMQQDTLLFALPQIPEPEDILINEILFNPYSGGSDFVELYNNSDKVFDLSKLRLSNYNESFQTLENVSLITEESELFLPYTYLALSNDPLFLKNNYVIKDEKTLVETNESLPSMPDGEGSIAISTSALTPIDYFVYTDELHLPFLEDAEGVSLERISFEKSAQENNNWQSAASTAGFATPGYKNSQYVRPQQTGDFSLSPKVFSPNMDGYHDVLQIEYAFEQANNLVSVYIFSADGALVQTLEKNTSVSQNGYFSWNGSDTNGALARAGIYIVVIDYFNENNTGGQWKQSCVLSL